MKWYNFSTIMEHFVLFCVFILGVSANTVEYDGWLNIKLLHSFGTNTEFVNRGNLTIQSVRSGGYSLEQNPLTPLEIEKLKGLAESDDFYRLQSIAQSADGTEVTYLSSIKAAILLETNLHDCISIWFLNNGGVTAIGISPSNIEPQPTSTINFQQLAVPNTFTTEIFIRHMEQAPVPDTASYIQKLEREREAREKGEFKDNRSFFAKYWMYIVPFVIFILLSSAANPEQASR